MDRVLGLLKPIASLWLTLALLVCVGLMLAYARAVNEPVNIWISLPFAGMCLNLLAALAVNYRLRVQPGLLVFHLALAGVAAMAAYGQLATLNGQIEITNGAAFDHAQVAYKAGPLHDLHLDRVRFIQKDFSIGFAPGVARKGTFSTVLLPDGKGGWREEVVGDDVPLIIQGYRFYAQHNKGYAPLITYIDAAGREQSGAVHMPPFPLNYFDQANDWSAPDGSAEVRLRMGFSEAPFDAKGHWEFAYPEDATLIVTAGDHRFELSPGDEAPIGAGRLRYERLLGWMGYQIYFDPMLSWMLGVAVIGTFGLGYHVMRKYLSQPWDKTDRKA